MKSFLSSIFSIFLLSQNIAFGHDMEDMKMNMSSSTSSNLIMNRDGSGTSWLPDSSPIYASHFMINNWSLMLHGSIFARYNSQNPFNNGKRGGNKYDAPNWFMAMAQTPILKNDNLTFRGMFSLDPLTIGGAGYPLLFQTGESWQGQPLIDSQHPHDLFSELSITYSHAINHDSNVFAYIGLPGEPAIGPTAFMHRPSTFSNPDAPIGHHWQDSTHIIFGVATLGWVYKDFKLDGSIFTGREPDENRYNIDLPRFDSYSGRATFNPMKDLSLQASMAYIKSPESLEPDINVYRTTASISHNKLFNPSVDNFTNLATSLIWGLNTPSKGLAQNSVLLESELQFFKNNFIYTKLEYVQKDTRELVLNLKDEKVYNIFSLTLGASRDIVSFDKLNLSIGAQTTLYLPQADLDPYYGKSPLAFQVYLRLSPDLMNMDSMSKKDSSSIHDMQKMQDMTDMDKPETKIENKKIEKNDMSDMKIENKKEKPKNIDLKNNDKKLIKKEQKPKTEDKKDEKMMDMDNM